jgi:hypothetical protein
LSGGGAIWITRKGLRAVDASHCNGGVVIARKTTFIGIRNA